MNKDKLLGMIFKRPTYRFHIRELARLTGLNPNTVLNRIKPLEKEGIVKTERKKHLTEVFANIEDSRFITEKRFFNLHQLTGLADFLDCFYKKPKAIVVMGSYSRGEDIERSDIDMVVIPKEKELPDLTRFERILGRKIHLILADYKDLSDEFDISLINGVVLKGYIAKK